jgi:hypothetical protein
MPPMNWWRREYFWPAALIVVGVWLLLSNLGLLNWMRPEIVWPVLIILLGLYLIVRRARA